MNGINEEIKLKRKDKTNFENFKLIVLLVLTNSLTFIFSSPSKKQAPTSNINRPLRADHIDIILPLKLYVPLQENGETVVSLFFQNKLIVPKAFIKWGLKQDSINQAPGVFSEEEQRQLFTVEIPKDELSTLVSISSKNKLIHASPFSNQFKKNKPTAKGASYVISI